MVDFAAELGVDFLEYTGWSDRAHEPSPHEPASQRFAAQVQRTTTLIQPRA
jgi:hypothetical protein